MSILRTHNLQNPDSSTINIVMDQDGNTNIAGITTVGSDLNITDKIVHAGDTNTAIRFPAVDTITAETGGTERLRITDNGKIVLPDSSLGIQFGTSGAAGLTSKTLDDYEEGTWTPIFDTSISTGTLSGLNYDIQEGVYIKIGSVVYVQGALRTSSVTNGGNGTYDISGLPFNAETSTNTNGAFFCYSQDSWTAAPHHFGAVSNTDHMRARGGISVGDASYTNGNTSNFDTASGSKNRVYFAGWYRT